MYHSVLRSVDAPATKYIITHVFCPLQLPGADDHSIHNDFSLSTAIAAAARLYDEHVSEANVPQWHVVSRMLENLQATTPFERLDASQIIAQLSRIDVGDVLTFFVRGQNAGVIFRKQKDDTLFESFEISPKASDVMATQGSLICSYPGPAIEIPNGVFYDDDFLSELASFLVHMDHDELDTASDTAHPRYITELLTGILRSLGRPASISRITKHVADEVRDSSGLRPWRRSSLWLLIRVALQTTLDRSPLGHCTYKEFILFFMCCIAREEANVDCSNDLLHFMSTKISQRLWKIGSTAPDWLSRMVLETCTSLRSTIEDHWRLAQSAQSVSPLWDPSQLDLSQDIQLSLLCSRDYLCNALADDDSRPPDIPFNPNYPPRGVLDDFLSSDSTFFEKLYQLEPHVTLYDVEQAIERGIDSWVARVSDRNEACVKLEILAYKYSSRASKLYANNPELLSVMLLTTVELWIALDKITIKEIPMLADYSPEVPMNLLESLLLSKAASLHRLRCACQYLSLRHVRSRDQWSTFSPTITKDSFGVRFYRKSSHLRRLKARIEEVARDEAREKVAELRWKNFRCLSGFWNTQPEHIQDNIRWIDVHEWPLPAAQLEAEVVMFELDCPISFSMWRSATFHLLAELCSPSVRGPGPIIRLNHNDSPLKPYFVKHPRSRISLGSNTRSSWRLRHSIPAEQEDVCLENGLKFFSFDMRTGAPVSEAPCRIEIRECCTYKLQSGPYHNLQQYVDFTSHTSNEVIANQADCHKDLSIHEYMAFGHLRSGSLLQWLNILRELRARSLSFRRPEVHMLLAQAISQVGPLESKGLTWHQEIQQPAFCAALLEELRNLVRDIEANWLEGVTMDTVSFLLRRILASSPNQTVTLEILGLLRTVRSKVFVWIQELLPELVKTPEDKGSRGVLRDIAAVCRSTFDVDPTLVPKLLHSAEDVDVLISSAILIHEHLPSDLSRLSTYSRLLLQRDCRLSLALESVLSNLIRADSHNQGINLAVRRIWSSYRPGSKWKALPFPNSRWIFCTTEPSVDRRAQVVYLNILDGSLVIDMKPLGTWLPNDFVRHPMYKLLFGERLFQVIPGGLPGMDYTTRDLISDHQVYLSLRNNGADLVIRAKRKGSDAEIMELIPHEELEGDLPTALLKGYAHWLNLSTSILEIRPLNALWETSPDNWKMDCIPGCYRMWKGRERLVDIRSRAWEMVSNLFKPLCGPQDLIVSAFLADTDEPLSSLQLSVHLPRYDLFFYVDEDGDLQSRTIRGMVYDENQYIGTLFGLVNYLVLCPKIRDHIIAELVPRCVLIPDGEVSLQTDDHHVCVKISADQSGLERVTYQTYKIDTVLGCLTADSGLTSKLYCAYLHALTSGYSTDPLTGRSGTEEALSILQSASCWSTVKFGSRDAELLCKIASICTQEFPRSKRLTQEVQRDRVPPLNLESHELYIISKAIKEHYERVALCHENELASLFEDFPLHVDQSPKCSAGRAAYLFPFAVSVEHSSANVGAQYHARDIINTASGEHRAYTAATYVYHRTAAGMKDIWTLVQSWGRNVSGDAALSLRYDKRWLSLDLPSTWLKMYNLLRGGDERKWFQLLFSLPATAYASPEHILLVPVFVAFALDPRFCLEDPPRYGLYPISEGSSQPSPATLSDYVLDNMRSFYHSPENLEHAEVINDRERLRLETDNTRLFSDVHATVRRLLAAWPCETPPSCLLNPSLYAVATLESQVSLYFSNCFRNLKLQEHLTRVQIILNDLPSKVPPVPDAPPYLFDPSYSIRSHTLQPLTIGRLFCRPAPQLITHRRLPRFVADTSRDTQPFGSTPLQQLLAVVDANATNALQCKYTLDLRTSAEHFGSEMSFTGFEEMELPTVGILMDHHARCRASYTEALQHLQQYLGPKSHSEQSIERSGRWPCVTAQTLFRCLASNSQTNVPDDWRRCLTSLALVALELQRARRLLLLHFGGLHEDFCRELQNEGCDGWDAETHPDWLLIQLDGNFLIRRIQAEVAKEMISPGSGENTAMQLNMGEGKSSVIVPIIAAVLANSEQLVRVIIPKPLVAQTLHILADRLGGLTSRRVYHLSFSRSLKTKHQTVAALRQILLECMQERGILVLQPEHVLSLKLTSVEKQLPLPEDAQLASLLVELQRWLHSHSRDILDESDEVLDVRSQLVFTIGHQRYMEGSSERWSTSQQVLGLVGKHAASLRGMFPLGVEYEPGPPGSFPHLRILQADAGTQLMSWIAEDITAGLLPNLSFEHLRPHSALRDAVRSFISCEDVPPTKVQLVKEHTEKTLLWGSLLLLRGLLNGILLFSFRERRWRVDYGLFPTRTMLAVPYQAKDVPAPRAEFGHPDIAIILTCLSYYYGGLSEEQLRLSFEVLLRQLDPSSDYHLWVQNCPAIPDPLRTFRGINLDSVEQWNQFLFPLFSRNRETVDFYLSKVVFPREANEFPSKLSSSGWDLAEKKDRVLTGFSGTNDGQYLLPLHITQRDPEHQRGTNAKVLSYLLQPENKHYMCMARENSERRTAREFLQILVAQRPEIRVLLDVGAQMLDLQNSELAKVWLDISRDASAAIYFNEDDELMVRARDGSTQFLRSSSFAQQLDRCVVYLDDAHTRGTDIEFPIGSRAAVTLGPKVTKDRLVQGCMRMRKLGQGHSVMFFAPLEIDRCIRSMTGKDKVPLQIIDTTDILRWAIQETWENIRRWAPHWVQQGMDHTSRYAAWSGFCSRQLTSEELSEKWLQPEAKSLRELYEPRNPSSAPFLENPDFCQRCTDLGVQSLYSVGMDEEQERELVYEVRRERQVERPPRVPPANHSIHQDVVDFVKTGVIPTQTKFFTKPTNTFKPAFDTLDATSAATDEAYVWSQSVLATKDFEETIEAWEKPADYARPVHWVVSVKRGANDALVILSPYEVNQLLPKIRASKKIRLHLYTPRISKSTKPCDDLSLYSIPKVLNGWIAPSSLMDQLNLFAGQLYLKDHETYIRLCRFLCVYTRDLRDELGVEPDGFVLPKSRVKGSETLIAHTFRSSPIIAIRALMDLRGKGVDFSSTHMGKLLRGRTLSRADFDGL